MRSSHDDFNPDKSEIPRLVPTKPETVKPTLTFDQATSALDAETGQLLLEPALSCGLIGA